jgi:hypothetical protein
MPHIDMTGTLRPLAALAVFALISAGCSSAPADTGTANSTAANHVKAMRFAQCMRDSGVGAFPDPDPSGALTIDAVANGTSIDPNSATFQQALSACRDLEPAGFMGQKRSSQQQQAALKFAQCIRDNGVKDFPDPAPDGPLINTNLIPSAATPAGMTNLQAAMRKCRGFAAAAGVTGGK